jgi:periplasmic divalent cation tolerance protein
LPRAAILVLTNLPDRLSAHALARSLVETRLAACVSIGAAHDSLYHWRGEIEMANEVPLAIKTCADLYPAVETAIRSRHPYELPEIIAVPIEHGLPRYLDWIAAESRSAGAADDAHPLGPLR